MPSANDHQLLHCRWNWCARTFELPSDLLSHLKSEHFRSILRVEKSELDEYLRCNEGRSGMTDSLLQALPTQSTEPSQEVGHDGTAVHAEPEPTEERMQVSNPRTPTQPSPPRDDATQERRTPTHSTHSSRSAVRSSAEPPRASPSQISRPSPSARTTPPNPPPHARARSFADCDAASSPITTPQPSPLPPTPPLHARIADAINAAAARALPPPLPRRTPARLPLSPASLTRPSRSPAHPLPLPRRGARAPAFGRAHARVSAVNASTDSAASARDVETQLTLPEDVPSATPSPPVPREGAGEDPRVGAEMDVDVEAYVPSLAYPEDPYPPLRTQAAYDSQGLRPKPSPSAATQESPVSGDAPSTQAEPEPQPSFTMQFSSGRLSLRMDSEPPEGVDAMDVDAGSNTSPQTQQTETQTSYPPLQLQTQALYPSQ